MRYLSLFSGVGGFDLGFDRAGMTCAGQVEYDEKPRAVLARHWPDVKRINDVREVQGDEFGTVDLICGGFPCQDVSVAGRRAGLAGERSGLWFEFHRLIDRVRPRWVVIENVPGLLSSHGGRDFAIILRGLVKCGYGVAWRVFDSQYDGVAQRRNRVFIVASLGNASCAEILFERESSAWDSPPRREAGQGFTHDLAPSLTAGGRGTERAGNSRGQDAVVAIGFGDNGSGVARCVTTGEGARQDYETCTMVVAPTLRSNGDAHGGFTTGDGLVLGFRAAGQDGFTPSAIAPPIASTDGGGAGVPTVAYNLTFCDANGRRQDRPNGGLYVNETEQANTLTNAGQNGTVIAFTTEQTPKFNEDQALTLTKQSPTGGGQVQSVLGQFGVRRLTPTECARLQGFPDDWNAFSDDGKPISDSARYKQLGNAVCVPTAEWIARRIIESLEISS